MRAGHDHHDHGKGGAHGGGHGHSHVPTEIKHERPLWIAFGLTLFFLLVEVAGGLWTNSLALLSDAAFAGVGVAGNDISPANMGVTVRYVVDRLCVAAGPASPNSCSVTSPAPQGGSNDTKDDDALPVQFVYRVSIRVDGPRRTQSFFQSTFTL